MFGRPRPRRWFVHRGVCSPHGGEATCSAVVSGKVAKESTVELIATYGPVSASGCILRAAPGVEHSKHVDRVAGLIGRGNNNDSVVIDIVRLVARHLRPVFGI